MTDRRRKLRLKDVALLQLYVKEKGHVPPCGKLADYIGDQRHRIMRRWDSDHVGATRAWDSLYGEAGFERPDGRGDWRRGRELTEEHRRRIAEGVRASWKQRKEQEGD